MRVSYASQYSLACVEIEEGDTFEAVKDRAIMVGAFREDREDYGRAVSVEYCVQFPGRPQELYTEEAMQRSFANPQEPDSAPTPAPTTDQTNQEAIHEAAEKALRTGASALQVSVVETSIHVTPEQELESAKIAFIGRAVRGGATEADALFMWETHMGINQRDNEQTVKDAQFVASSSLNDLSQLIHKLNRKWWVSFIGKPLVRNKGELMMLMVSEISEAMEGARKNLKDDKLTNRPAEEVELADLLIRVFDYAGGFGLDLSGAVQEKLAYNLTRKDHSHAERVKENGKKF